MRNVLFLLACCVLSGCAASSRYEAKRLDDTLIDPKRILIIESPEGMIRARWTYSMLQLWMASGNAPSNPIMYTLICGEAAH